MTASHFVLTVLPYTTQKREEWDSFVRASSVFFQWQRSYMDYHADRFEDASVFVLNHKKQIRALFPANRKGSSIVSHGGLTFGGLIFAEDVPTEEAFAIAQSVVAYFRQHHINSFTIKCLPSYLECHHADKQLVAWQQIGATIHKAEFSYLVPLTAMLHYQRRRKRMIQKSKRAGVSIQKSDDWAGFWQILTENLQSRHQTIPVHTFSEIELLAGRFPNNIQLFVSKIAGRILAGIVLYYYEPLVVHAQYIAANQEGKQCGALDILTDFIIQNALPSYRHLSLGVNTLRPSHALNWGLVAWKEGFGAQPFAQYEYQLVL